MEALSPRQLAQKAQEEYQKKNFISAAGLYKAAAEGFLTSGDELKAAEMANDCSVAYLKGGNGQAALDATSGTDKVFEQKGDIRQQAIALGNQAAAMENMQRFDEAIATYLKSAELLKEVGEFELRAYVMQALSRIQMRRRRYLEAYATLREGIMGIRKPNFKQRLLKSLIQIPYNFLK